MALTIKGRLTLWYLLVFGTIIVVTATTLYLVYRNEKHQLEQLQAKVRKLEQQREQMAKEVLRLRNDPKALEELVHRELGYVHPDEYVLIFPKKKEEKKP